MRTHVHAGVVIECASESEHRQLVSKVTSTAKDGQLCSQARAIINRVVEDFAWLKVHSGGHGPLKRTEVT